MGKLEIVNSLSSFFLDLALYFLQEGKYIEHIHDKRKTTILEYMDEIEKHFEDLKPYRNKKEYTEDISFQILEYINCIVNYLPLLPLSKKWAEYEKWVKDQKKMFVDNIDSTFKYIYFLPALRPKPQKFYKKEELEKDFNIKPNTNFKKWNHAFGIS